MGPPTRHNPSHVMLALLLSLLFVDSASAATKEKEMLRITFLDCYRNTLRVWVTFSNVTNQTLYLPKSTLGSGSTIHSVSIQEWDSTAGKWEYIGPFRDVPPMGQHRLRPGQARASIASVHGFEQCRQAVGTQRFRAVVGYYESREDELASRNERRAYSPPFQRHRKESSAMRITFLDCYNNTLRVWVTFSNVTTQTVYLPKSTLGSGSTIHNVEIQQWSSREQKWNYIGPVWDVPWMGLHRLEPGEVQSSIASVHAFQNCKQAAATGRFRAVVTYNNKREDALASRNIRWAYSPPFQRHRKQSSAKEK